MFNNRTGQAGLTFKAIHGTLSTSQLPKIPAANLTGTLSISVIPDAVWLYGMQTNDLVGTISLRNLPVATITDIVLSHVGTINAASVTGLSYLATSTTIDASSVTNLPIGGGSVTGFVAFSTVSGTVGSFNELSADNLVVSGSVSASTLVGALATSHLVGTVALAQIPVGTIVAIAAASIASGPIFTGSISAGSVTGLGSLALLNAVPTTSVTGTFPFASITGAGALAALNTVDASSVTGLGALALLSTIPTTLIGGTFPATSITGLGSLALLSSVSVASVTGLSWPATSTTIPTASLTGTFPASSISGTIPSSSISGTFPTASLTGSFPASSISGLGSLALLSSVSVTSITGLSWPATMTTIPTASLTGTFPAASVSGLAANIQTLSLASLTASTVLSGSVSASYGSFTTSTTIANSLVVTGTSLVSNGISSKQLLLSPTGYFFATTTYRQIALLSTTGDGGNGAALHITGVMGIFGASASVDVVISTRGGLNVQSLIDGTLTPGNIDLMIYQNASSQFAVYVKAQGYINYTLTCEYSGVGGILSTTPGAETTTVPSGGSVAWLASANSTFILNGSGSVTGLLNASTLTGTVSYVDGWPYGKMLIGGQVGQTTGNRRTYNWQGDGSGLTLLRTPNGGDPYGANDAMRIMHCTELNNIHFGREGTMKVTIGSWNNTVDPTNKLTVTGDTLLTGNASITGSLTSLYASVTNMTVATITAAVHAFPSPAWATMTAQNSWNLSSGLGYPLTVANIFGRCCIRGGASKATGTIMNNTIFTLPSQFRPANRVYVPGAYKYLANNGSVTQALLVNSDGTCYLQTTDTGDWVFEGLNFLIGY